MNGQTADILSTRLAAATAYQMVDHAQGYFDLTDYGSVVGLAWYSDTPGQWSCAVKHGPEDAEQSAHTDRLFDVVATDKAELEAVLEQELSSALHA